MKIELLESRIAPASLAFTDVDGDHVVITVTGAGTLTMGGNVLFDGTGHQLKTLDLRAPAFEHASVSIVATRGASGDGLVNVGYINATGRDLGTVSVDGDLGAIDAGNAAVSTPACQTLTVLSLGNFGITTGAPDLSSDFAGKLGALHIKASADNSGSPVIINADSIGGIKTGGTLDANLKTTGDVGAVQVGGALQGTFMSGGKIASVTVGTDLNSVQAAGDIGPVKTGGGLFDLVSIGGKLTSLTTGGDANFVECGANMGAIKVGGSVTGGMLTCGGTLARLTVSGFVDSTMTVGGNIGPVSVGGDFFATLQSTGGQISQVLIGGSLMGSIEATTHLGTVKIGEDFGSTNGLSGIISSQGAIDSVSIGRSLVGGVSNSQAEIFSKGNIGSIHIHGDMLGSAAKDAAKIDCGGNLTSVIVDGAITGGSGAENLFNDGTLTHEGQIYAVGSINSVKVGGDLRGSSGVATAEIRSHTHLGTVAIGGTVQGIGQASGQIASDGSIGSVRIGGDLSGQGTNSGRIGTGGVGPGGNIGSIFIGGSLFGGFDPSGDNAGLIFSGGDIGSIHIAQDFNGGTITSSTTVDRSGLGYIEGGHIGSVYIGGNFSAASNFGTHAITKSGAISARDDLGSLTVKGSVIGSSLSSVVITAYGSAHPTAKSDVAIGQISVSGQLQFARIFAGYNPDLTPANADAQIGTVHVGGNWVSSDLLAGVTSGTDAIIGNVNDAKIANTGQARFKDTSDALGVVSKIAQVIIDGTAIGTANATDNLVFGIEAQQIVSLKLGGGPLPLTAGAGNDLFAKRVPLGPTRGTSDIDGFDFHAFEI